VNVLNRLISDRHTFFSTPSDQGVSGIPGLLGFVAAPIVGMMKLASGAMHDLTPEHMASFNRKYKDVPTVKYYSVTSTFNPWFTHLF
jgi:hypothetical protein